jgi:NAD-dependent deacetylase
MKMSWIRKDNAPLEERIARINSIIKGCSRIAFFGGAGVSTKSGIPDFRSRDGMYSKPDPEFAAYQPEYLLSSECLTAEPEVFYRFYRKKMDMRGYEPNVIHRKLAELEADGKMAGVITQNIDGLHEAAGTEKIAKIHGTAATCFCSKCGKVYDPGKLFEDTGEKIPKCMCGGMLRPDVVLYGELLPGEEMSKAYGFLEEADCLIVCGTSVALPHIRNMIRSYTGTYLIVLNGTETLFDGYADVTCHEDIFEIFEKVRWK